MGITRQDFICSLIFWSCSFFFLLMDTHLRSAISLLCLQLPCKGGQSRVRLFLLEGGKRIIGTVRRPVCLQRGVQTHEHPWTWAWIVCTPFYSVLGGRESVADRNRSPSIYTHWTKIIFCSDKHCINDIIRKQGPLHIFFSSAPTLDGLPRPSRDFSWAKEIFTWLPVNPVMGKREAAQTFRFLLCTSREKDS